ncbi:MAG: ABC transporter ATP-binding protein [Acidobacteria bacterium]|nr:ABC transporter ATP-binding protein [Acidobacteriota bacterium]
MAEPLLEIADLQTHLFTDRGVVRAVDGVSFSIERGASLGLVGESGCGKSITGLSIIRLLPPSARMVGGAIRFEGQNLLELPAEPMRRLRGRRIAMVFQDPMTSLNPVFTVGTQIAEPLVVHENLSRRAAWDRAVELMRQVAIPDPARRARSYPHELSGGMRQRAMIAMAISCGPALLIADEPTTALDVTIQAEILELLGRLRRDMGLSILLITHDLGVVAENTDDVAVMYAGKIVERGSVREIFRSPQHPYTIGLLRCVPRITTAGDRQGRLETIEGVVPNPFELPPGCAFAPRCPEARAECDLGEIDPYLASEGHVVRCVARGSSVRKTSLDKTA